MAVSAILTKKGYQRVSRRKSRKNKKGNKKSLFLLILLLIFIFISYVLIPLGRKILEVGNRWDYLKISHIDIKGNKRVSIEQIKNCAGIREGLNILSLDLDNIVNSAYPNPWIKSLKVERRFPDSISIEVEESSPVAIWKDEEKQYAMDEFGTLLEENSRAAQYSRLPVLTGFRAGISKVGDICPSPYWSSGLKVADSVKEIFPELMNNIFVFYIASEDQIILLLKNNKRILLSIADVDVKLYLLKAIIVKIPGNWHSMEYCDMRFKDKIIFG